MSKDNKTKEQASEQVEEIKGEQNTEISELDTVKQALEQSKKDYLLSLAELENTRKRVQKEKHESIKFAQENLITDFLTPMDNFENALGFAQNMSEEMKSWAQGFSMILEQFKDILNQHNVKAFSSEGQTFNPELHEVIEMESTSEVAPGTILKEFTKGYQCGDRVLRPARVKISKAPAEPQSGEEDEMNQLNENNSEA